MSRYGEYRKRLSGDNAKSFQEADELAEIVSLEEKDIEDAISVIMVEYGPDRHSDGSDVIAHFIMSLLARVNDR